MIAACDKAIAEQKKQIEIRDLMLTTSGTEIDRLSKDVQDKDSKLASIWRNPFVMIGLGLIGGILITK